MRDLFVHNIKKSFPIKKYIASPTHHYITVYVQDLWNMCIDDHTLMNHPPQSVTLFKDIPLSVHSISVPYNSRSFNVYEPEMKK